MQAIGSVLILLWMVAVVISIIALVRGHMDWLRLPNRKTAALFLLATQLLLVAGVVIMPKAPQSSPAAAPVVPAPSATAVISPPTNTPTSTTDTPAPPTTTPSTTTPPAATTAALDAEGADIAYIAVLDENGVRYDSKAAAISVGHKVCTARAAGNTETAIGMTIVNTGMYSAQDAGVIVGDAEAAYCPQFK